jgi:hypothetical protein
MGKGMADRCSEIRLRAERRAGEMLKTNGPNRGGDTGSNQHSAWEAKSQTATSPSLDDLGVSKSQSSRWQRLAEVPEDAFESYFEAARSDEKADTTATGLMQHAARERQPGPVTDPVPPREGSYRSR